MSEASNQSEIRQSSFNNFWKNKRKRVTENVALACTVVGVLVMVIVGTVFVSKPPQQLVKVWQGYR